MSILGNLVSGGISGIADAVDKFVETPDEKAAMALKERALALQPIMAQIQLNEKEAEHSSVFVAGWRPAIGWICGAALAYHFILEPLLEFIIRIWIPDFNPPAIDLGQLWPVLMGMLGLGGMRSWEKMKGIHRSSIGK